MTSGTEPSAVKATPPRGEGSGRGQADASPAAPTVSVVIPAYNAAWCVGKAIDSVLAQDFRDFELIVVDDGSTDDTAAVLAGYGEAIRVVHKPNGGMSSARNAGIAVARGEFVAFLDADDWWLPGKLAKQVALMRQRPEVGFSSTTARVEDQDGRLLNLWTCDQEDRPILLTLFASNAGIAGGSSALMVRRDLLERVGPYDETLGGVEDGDLWMRLAAVSEYACLEEPLVVVLRRSGSVSRNVEGMRMGAIRVMHKNRGLLPPAYRGHFWRDCLAGVYADYAKWRYRAGQHLPALLDAARILALSPSSRGRLGLGLLRDILLGRPL
jgi:glycosyltransferase involved in cell wall biosynthesis